MPQMLKAGSRLFSAVCSTEMIAVKAPEEPVDVTIGGSPPLPSDADRTGNGTVEHGHGGGTAMGKRYVDADGTVELLCTKPGDGVPALGGVLLEIKDAKPLPSSD
jgi:hypothetical protein